MNSLKHIYFELNNAKIFLRHATLHSYLRFFCSFQVWQIINWWNNMKINIWFYRQSVNTSFKININWNIHSCYNSNYIENDIAKLWWVKAICFHRNFFTHAEIVIPCKQQSIIMNFWCVHVPDEKFRWFKIELYWTIGVDENKHSNTTNNRHCKKLPVPDI